MNNNIENKANMSNTIIDYLMHFFFFIIKESDFCMIINGILYQKKMEETESLPYR